MTTAERLDVVSRDPAGVFHRRFRSPRGALVGARGCFASTSERELPADERWVLDDVDREALCRVCFPAPEPLP
ncbi:MAG TPA: hypothetical protein VFW86_02570 [Candidatus Limnocylindrales bacterium]|nr:hypothetical protein [Candidatus Limnocylindrales bacterium]